MFGDIVDPSVKVGTQQWYTVPVSILVHTAAVLALIVHPVDGGRRAADAAVDAGVRGCAATAATAATATAAAAPGCGAQAGRRSESGSGAD